MIVSGDLGVFFLRKPRSDPKSTTWTRLGTNLPNTSIQDIKIQASTHTLYAMTLRPRRADDPAPAAVPVHRVHVAGREPAGAEPARTRSRTIPVKFSLGGDYGTDILATGYPQSVQISCTTLDPIAGTPAPTNGGLGFEAGQYKYLWKTEKRGRAPAGSSS